MNIPNGDLEGNPIIQTVVGVITPEGGVVHADANDLSVQFLPGSVIEPMEVELAVTESQLPSLLQEGYALSANGAVLTFDATRLSQTPQLNISLPQSAFGETTVLCVADPSGAEWPIPTFPSEDGARRIGHLPIAFFFPDEESLTPVSEREYSLRIYTASVAPFVEAATFESYAAIFDPVRGVWNRSIPSLAGKRVAIVVHGILSSLDDLITLASAIAAYAPPGSVGAYYDAVIGFNYTSTAPIAQIGSALVAQVGSIITGTRANDLFAHSMGNLVSRSAMEVGSSGRTLGPIGNYVSLGGPHAGVPFGASWLINEFLKLFNPSFRPCLTDLLTDGFNGPAKTPFLPSINTNRPNPQGTRYYSMAGTDHRNYNPPMGTITYWWYYIVVGYRPQFAVEDGLVAVWSAQSTILKVKDPKWNMGPWATQYWTHSGLHSAPTALDVLRRIITSWASPAAAEGMLASATAVAESSAIAAVTMPSNQ